MSLSHYKIKKIIKSIDDRLILRKGAVSIISEMIDNYIELIVSIIDKTIGSRRTVRESDMEAIQIFVNGIFKRIKEQLSFIEKIATNQLDVNEWVRDFAVLVIDRLESVICETVGIDTETICNAVITLVLEIMKQLKSELGDID